MRDPKRDQESLERFTLFSDENLVIIGRRLNRELLRQGLVLSGVADLDPERIATLTNLKRAMRRLADTAKQLRDVRYELGRRGVPHPNGAVINVTQQGQGANITASQTIGTNSGTAAGVDIGEIRP